MSNVKKPIEPRPVEQSCPRIVGRGTRLYFAAPKRTYSTKRYHRLLAALHRKSNGAEVIESRTAFSSLEDWKANWPSVRDLVEELVFITDEEGFIGRGVHKEIDDAQNEELPVYFLDEAGEIVEYHRLQFTDYNDESWKQFVRVAVAPERQP